MCSASNEKLEAALDEKLDHGAYDGATYRWIVPNELYVEIPDNGTYTRTVETSDLPPGWSIATVWHTPEKMLVSIKPTTELEHGPDPGGVPQHRRECASEAGSEGTTSVAETASVEETIDSSEAEHRQSVTLERTVEVPELTPGQRLLFAGMAEIFADNFETFVEKNIDYGSSFLTAGRAEARLAGEADPVFDDPGVANLYKTWTEIQHKNKRFYQQAFAGGSDLVGEDLVETCGDAGNYWFMTEYLARNELETHLDKLLETDNA